VAAAVPVACLLTTADTTALVEYYATHAIPIRPQTGVLIASICVSILGSYATLLVLGRRTSPRGFRNLTLLLLAALCFSAVAVWGMHFVSMISITLQPTPNHHPIWYITFSPGMTVMSLFVPLIATSFAFWFLASETEFDWRRAIISGPIVGLTSEF
jgi:NO-binding membrane sensor protein with MHYT domain